MTPMPVRAGLVIVGEFASESAPDVEPVGSRARASPKSSTLTVPSGRTLMLAGLRRSHARGRGYSIEGWNNTVAVCAGQTSVTCLRHTLDNCGLLDAWRFRWGLLIRYRLVNLGPDQHSGERST